MFLKIIIFFLPHMSFFFSVFINLFFFIFIVLLVSFFLNTGVQKLDEQTQSQTKDI
jgi:hypothetical protein